MTVRLLPYDEWVFGWGDAPTTRYLLAELEARVRPGMRVADVGGGTGILGIRAAQLGAQVVVFEAVQRWRDLIARNAEFNGVSLEVRGGFPDDHDGQRFDFLVANLGSRQKFDWSLYAEAWADGEAAPGGPPEG